MDPNLVRGKKSKKEKCEEADYDEAEEENDECLPPPLTPVESQDVLGHRNLLKYRAEILKYQADDQIFLSFKVRIGHLFLKVW